MILEGSWSQRQAIQYFEEMVTDWIDDELAEMDPNWTRVLKNPHFKKELAKVLNDVEEEYYGEGEEMIVDARFEAMHHLLRKHNIGKWVGY